MSDESKIDPAIYPMIFWYSQACYPVFEQIGYDAAQEASNAAGDFSLVEPLLMRGKGGKFASIELPHFGERSAPFCAALMSAFLVWASYRTSDAPYIPDSVLLKAADDGYRLWKRTNSGK